MDKDKLRTEGRFRLSDQAYKRSNGDVQPVPVPSMSSLKYLSSGSRGKSKDIPMDDIVSILGNANISNSSGIAQYVQNASPYMNNAQYTAETIRYMRNMANLNKTTSKHVGQDFVMFGMDTEWLAGGTFGKAAPVELGITPMVMRNGVINPIDPAKKIAVAVQLDEASYNEIRTLVNRLKDAKSKGTVSSGLLNLTDDEYRTLRDLINYSGDSIQNGLIERKTKKSIATKANLVQFVDEIEDGLENLNPNGKHTKAIKRGADLSNTVREIMANHGFRVDTQSAIVGFHNGISGNADWAVWENSFGLPMHEIFGLKKPVRMYDPLSVVRSTNTSSLLMHKGTDGVIDGPATLTSILNLVNPQAAAGLAHSSDWDSYATAEVMRHQWNSGAAKIDISRAKYGAGSQLFSMAGMSRGADTPLDYIVENQNGQWVPRAYPNSVYRNRMHTIQNEFTYQFNDKTYYGVVLKNEDDDLVSIIARPSMRELQTSIQNNFINMDTVTKKKGLRKGILDYVASNRAAAEYDNMFRGTSAYSTFNRNMTAYDYVVNNGLTTVNNHGRRSLNANAMPELTKLGMTDTQIQKFSGMFERMDSEIELLNGMRTQLNALGNNYKQKNVALQMFKQDVDSVFGRHTTKITLPTIAYSQVNVFDPTVKGGGMFKAVDARDKSNLASGIRRMAVDGRGNSRHGFLEARERLRTMVSYMSYGGQYGSPILNNDQASTLYNLIDRMKVPETGLGGIGDMASAVADMAYDNLRTMSPANQIEMESMAYRALDSTKKSAFISSSRLGDITTTAGRFFDTSRTLSAYDNTVRTALDRVDEMIRANVSAVSSAVAQDPSMGPRSIYDAVSDMAYKYNQAGISMDISLSNKKGPGLELVMYASDTATSVVNAGRADAVNVFIPLLDRDTGMFQVNGVQTTNRFRPIVNRDGKAMLETYQNKVFEVLGYGSNVSDVADMIKGRKSDQALALLERNIRASFEGLSSGSMYGYDEMMKDRIGSTIAANNLKGLQVDMKDLLYLISGKDKYDRKSWSEKRRNTFSREDKHAILSGIAYRNSTIMKSPAGGHNVLPKVFNVLDQLGLNIDTSSVKAETAVDAVFNIAGIGDSRNYGVFGYWNDPATENIKASLRYFTLNGNSRMATPRLMTQSYLKDSAKIYADGGATHVNLYTAFMSDQDISDIAIGRENFDPIARVTTHDDMMSLDKKALSAFNTYQERKLIMPEGVNPSNWTPNSIITADSWLDANARYGDVFNVKYDAIVKNVRLNRDSMRYEMIVDEAVDAKMGMKLQGIHAGNKFSVGVTDSIVEQMGWSNNAYGKGIQAVVNPKTFKRPGDIIASQLALIVNEMDTVGKSTTAAIRSGVEEFMVAALGKDRTDKAIAKLLDNIQIIETANGRTVVMPDDVRGNLHIQNAFDKAEEILGRIGSTNVIQSVNGRKIYRGYMAFSRTNVFDTADTVGADDGLVKLGFRELDILRSRKHLIGADISGVIGAVEDKIFTNAAKYKSEAAQMFDVLRQGKDLTNQDEYGIIRTRGVIREGLDKDFSEITPFIRSENGKYLDRHLKGTIVDDKLFGGKGFFLEMPETVEISGKVGGQQRTMKVDKLFIPSMHTDFTNGEAFVTGPQAKVKQLYETIKQYRDNSMSGQDELKQRAFKDARNKLPGLVDDYLTELGNAMHQSHGYLQENLFSQRVEHAGRFKYRGFNPLDYGEGTSEKLQGIVKEGHGLVSNRDFAAMIDGVDDATRAEILKQARSAEGFAAIGIRYPSKDIDTSLPMMLHVLDEDYEKELSKHTGKLDGNVWVTLGTQMRHNADHDGDTMSIVLAQLGGAKAGRLNKSVNEQMRNWFQEESKYNVQVAKEVRENLDYTTDLLVGGRELGSDIEKALQSGLRDRLGLGTSEAELADFVAKVEAKLQKEQVGRYSNLSVKVRRMAETVGSLTEEQIGRSAWNPFIGLSYFLTAAEQAPISAKKIGEQLQNFESKTGQQLTQDTISKYIGASEGLYEAISNLDGKAAVEQATMLGFFKDDVFVGATKAEGKRAKAVLNRSITATDVIDYFDVLKQSFNNPNMWDATLTTGMSQFDNAFQAMGWADDLHSGNSQYVFGAMKDFLTGIGKEALVDKITTNATTAFNVNQRLLDPLEVGKFASKMSQGNAYVETVGDLAKEKVADIGASIMEKMTSPGALGGIGLAMGGLYAVGAVVGGASSREIEQPAPDQAPSSDGQYVNPSIYAGAPSGAGPTARLLPNGGGYEKLNVKISANTMSGMSNEEIASLVSEEIRRQASIDVNLKVTSEDNTTNVDKQWLQQQFADALSTGYTH